MDHATVEAARRKMLSLVEQHAAGQRDTLVQDRMAMETELAAAKEKLAGMAVLECRLEHAQQLAESRDAALAAKDAALEIKSAEVVSLRGLLCEALPKKTGSLLSKVLGCTQL